MVPTLTTPMSKKYVIWISPTMGEYVKADDVQVSHDTVSFILKGKLQKTYNKKDIIEYKEVE